MFALGLIAGLLVGWNFFPQPKIINDWMARIVKRYF